MDDLNGHSRHAAVPAVIAGIGLHTGQPVSVTIQPCSTKHGIVFRRADLDSPLEILTSVDNVIGHTKSVTLGVSDDNGCWQTVDTVEHLLAALAGLGIWDALVEVDGPEIPAGDGSARHIADVLRANGWRTLSPGEGPFITISRLLLYRRSGEGVKVIGLPYDGFRISYAIDFPDTAVGWRQVSVDLADPKEIAAVLTARTFVFLDDLVTLRRQGRYLGVSPARAELIPPTVQRNEHALCDQFARHKVLDAMGDIWGLLGRSVRGHLIVLGGGHRDHVKFAQRLIRFQQDAENWPDDLASITQPEMQALVHQLGQMQLTAEADAVRAAWSMRTITRQTRSTGSMA